MKILLWVILSFLIDVYGYSQTKPLESQRAYYKCSKSITIDSSKIEIVEGKVYFQFDQKLNPLLLDLVEFDWLDKIDLEYFTAYLINTSDSIFNPEKQDLSLMIIQEAKNDSGEWKPIEYWVYSGCDWSYLETLNLQSGLYVAIPIRKYRGKYKTKIRLKMKNNNSIFYSDEFDGEIEKSQFEVQTKKVKGVQYLGPASYFDSPK
jgi:hypothetical protein